MNPLALLTVEQVKDYFSATTEFKVTETAENLKLSYTVSGKTTSLLIYKEDINIQQLIREVSQLVWNHCNNILD